MRRAVCRRLLAKATDATFVVHNGPIASGQEGATYDDPFHQPFQAQPHRNASNSNDNGNATPYGDTKAYAGVSSSSLATTASSQLPAVQYSDNLLKHPEARSTVNVLPARATPPSGAVPASSTPPVRPRRDDTAVYNFGSLASPLPLANQTEFGPHPAHERNASSSLLNLARLVHLQHSKTPSGGSMRGYEPGPSAPLFSRTKRVANGRKDTALSIDGRSESGSAEHDIGHGRIENASHYGEIEDASSEAYQHYPGPRNASSPRWKEAPRA
ncbi:hypothetical protein AURDEDRAFT_166658 [Auricularia subglabra TFB-10046 SS5]|nr:hypothetical protein AURDEDRAFT_166658 [Auricularia subglabra TFB-10046 SS5]